MLLLSMNEKQGNHAERQDKRRKMDRIKKVGIEERNEWKKEYRKGGREGEIEGKTKGRDGGRGRKGWEEEGNNFIANQSLMSDVCYA